MSVDNRQKAVEMALSQIKKQFGDGSVMLLGDKNASIECETISSGSLNLDLALGIGGYPKGRIVEIYGPESSGKTTLTLHAIAECQKRVECSFCGCGTCIGYGVQCLVLISII